MTEEKVKGGRKPRKELRNKATRKRRKAKQLLQEVSLDNYNSYIDLEEVRDIESK